jgi:hypothetical protein
MEESGTGTGSGAFTRRRGKRGQTDIDNIYVKTYN